MPSNEQVVNILPIYDIERTYAENVAHGPFFDGAMPERTWLPQDQWIDFMGHKVASPLGVPAGPLLASRWIALAGALGFDILTYKTIRSHAYPGHPLPNVIFVEKDPNNPQIAKQRLHPPEDSNKINITNSFGMPSMPPEFLLQDIRHAKKSLKKGQILIVSVTGTPDKHNEITDDFIKTALIAKAAGADVIEANFSCPNVGSKDGSLFCDPETSFKIASKLSKAIFPIPLMIKVGKYPQREIMQKALTAFARANVRGICGINTIPAQVLKADGTPALGPSRETSGICGDMIRIPALEFLRDAHDIIHQERLSLELAGCGGIMLPEHFDDFLKTGAKVAMTATGMMWNPYLAKNWHERKKA